jgi:hypothetical protein
MKIKFGKGAKACPQCHEKVPGARTHTCPHCQADLRKEVVSLQSLIERSGVNEHSPYKATYLEMLNMAEIDHTTVFPYGYNPPSDIDRIRITDYADPKSVEKFNGELDEDNLISWSLQIRENQLRQGRYLTNAALSGLVWGKLTWTSQDEYQKIKGLTKSIKSLPDVEFRLTLDDQVQVEIKPEYQSSPPIQINSSIDEDWEMEDTD